MATVITSVGELYEAHVTPPNRVGAEVVGAEGFEPPTPSL